MIFLSLLRKGLQDNVIFPVFISALVHQSCLKIILMNEWTSFLAPKFKNDNCCRFKKCNSNLIEFSCQNLQNISVRWIVFVTFQFEFFPLNLRILARKFKINYFLYSYCSKISQTYNLNFRAKICKTCLLDCFCHLSVWILARKLKITYFSGHCSKTYNLNFPAKIARCASKKKVTDDCVNFPKFFHRAKSVAKSKVQKKVQKFFEWSSSSIACFTSYKLLYFCSILP